MGQSKSTQSGSEPTGEESSVDGGPVRILVTGDREWYCPDLAEKILGRLFAHYGFESLVVVHGGCRGVDMAFEHVCRRDKIKTEIHCADWNFMGKWAGPARNQRMIDAGADYCLVLHRNISASKGTKDCATRALKAGIICYLIQEDPDVVEVVVMREVAHLDRSQPFLDLGD